MLNGVVNIAGGVMVLRGAFFVVRGVLISPVEIVAVCRWVLCEMWVLWVERVCLEHFLCDLVMFLVFFLDVRLFVRMRF